MRTEIKINKLLGIKDGTFYFVNSTFQYEPGDKTKPITLKGVGFTKMEGLTEEQMQDRIDGYDWKESRQMAVIKDKTENGLRARLENMDDQEKQERVRDSSYEDVYLGQMQAIEPDIAYADWVGGGRSRNPEMMNADYRDSNFDPDLAKLCQEAESD